MPKTAKKTAKRAVKKVIRAGQTVAEKVERIFGEPREMTPKHFNTLTAPERFFLITLAQKIRLNLGKELQKPKGVKRYTEPMNISAFDMWGLKKVFGTMSYEVNTGQTIIPEASYSQWQQLMTVVMEQNNRSKSESSSKDATIVGSTTPYQTTVDSLVEKGMINEGPLCKKGQQVGRHIMLKSHWNAWKATPEAQEYDAKYSSRGYRDTL